MSETQIRHSPLPVDWDAEAIIHRRDTWYAASQRAFVPYRTPQIFARGAGQYLWGVDGRRFIDLLGMNVCVSVGHANPTVSEAVVEQVHTLQHCTTMFYHPVPAHYAEELTATMPAGRAVLQVLNAEKLQANAQRVGAALYERLVDLKKRYCVIGDVRGRGLMLAIELVTDRQSRTPNPDATARVFELARSNGLILSKSGPDKSVLRFVPPLCLSMQDVDSVADGLDASFKAL